MKRIDQLKRDYFWAKAAGYAKQGQHEYMVKRYLEAKPGMSMSEWLSQPIA